MIFFISVSIIKSLKIRNDVSNSQGWISKKGGTETGDFKARKFLAGF